MKFSHILFSHLTPEWRAHYIDYDVRAFPLLFRARRGRFLVYLYPFVYSSVYYYYYRLFLPETEGPSVQDGVSRLD